MALTIEFGVVFFLLGIILVPIFWALLYLQRQARWYYLRATEMYEKNRFMILQNKEKLWPHDSHHHDYDAFDESQANALTVTMPKILECFLDKPGTCPICHRWQRCPPDECLGWMEQADERQDKGKKRELNEDANKFSKKKE